MNTIIPIGPKYQDERGTIQMIMEDSPFHSLSFIESKAGSTRAGHWHKEDSHYCLALNGPIYYYERPVGSKDKPILVIVQGGQIFYTPPMVEHEMFFPDDNVFVCMSTLSRKNADYEHDTSKNSECLKKLYEGK
jgi:hypothetical protein